MVGRAQIIWRLLVSVALAAAFMALPGAGGTGVAASYTATPPAAGNGSPGAPYQIATADNLIWFDQKAATTAGAHYDYELTHSIDMAGYAGWTPVLGFSGTFDGQGHTVSGLVTNTPATYSDGNRYLGMFGYTLGGSVIKDLTVQDWSMTYQANGSTTYPVGAAGLVASNGGLVENVTVSTASADVQAYNAGLVVGEDNDSYTSTSGASAPAEVDDTVTHGALTNDTPPSDGMAAVGGVMGQAGFSTLHGDRTSATTINDSAAGAAGLLLGEDSGTVPVVQGSAGGTLEATAPSQDEDSIGGLIGESLAPVNTSQVTATITGGYFVGGLVGRLEAAATSKSDTTSVTMAVYSSGADVGGVVGFLDGSGPGPQTLADVQATANLRTDPIRVWAGPSERSKTRP